MRRFSRCALAVAATGQIAGAADARPGIEFFETRIRPVLVEKCYQCHSVEADKRKGGLLLDSRDGIRKGGDRGPALVPGDPGNSLLLTAIRHADQDLKMPPKEKLPETVVADFTAWIKMGAPDPRAGQAPPPQTAAISIEEGRKWWSLQPIQRPAIPAVKDRAWPRTDIDRFVLAGLEAKGLKPVADADPRTFIRRASFDLTGLPPTPEEVQSFVAASTRNPQSAIRDAVDRLLASPRFGERWGRHWLDIARYAESTGRYRNVPYIHAWRYRDYVIDSFNRDKPYDQFVREQIAGDLMPATDTRQRQERDIATGFLALGPKELHEKKLHRYRMDIADEQIDVVGRAILGLTVACARCHDHKTDPIPTEDYYALAGIFYSTEPLLGFPRDDQPELFGTGPKPLAGRELSFTLADHEELVRLYALRYKQKLAADRGRRARLLEAGLLNAPAEEQRAFLKGIPEQIKADADLADTEARLAKLRARWLAGMNDLAMGVRDARPTDLKVHVRGEDTILGAEVPRGFLRVLADDATPAVDRRQSGRLQLADWLASPRNPLTGRVIVNRVWHHLFGAGIVTSVDDFGRTGEPPTNPALLDHLATRLLDHRWSLKALIREIMLSRVYQLASNHDGANYEADAANTLHWRMSRRRLDVHALRDSILACSGALTLDRPASPVVPQWPMDRVKADIAAQWHQKVGPVRTVYLPVVRDFVPHELRLFDLPDPELVTGARNVTTVPTQALYMLNNSFLLEQSQRLAGRILADSGTTDNKRIERLYLLLFARPPDSGELRDAAEFLANYPSAEEKDHTAAWAALCQVLLGSGEFRYVY
jgi:hypothetical protein